MKKFTLGLIVGFILALSVPAFGEISNLLGKTVDGEILVYIDGSKFNDNAIVVNSRSYLPVRSFAETLGKNVEFKDGEISVTETQTIIKTEIQQETAKLKISSLMLNLIDVNEKEMVETCEAITLDSKYYLPVNRYTYIYPLKYEDNDTRFTLNNITFQKNVDQDGIKWYGGRCWIRPDAVGMTLTQQGDIYYLR